MSQTKQAVIALVIANFIWGAASPIFKWSLNNIPPFTLAFLRFSLASFLFFPWVYYRLFLKPKDILLVFGIGFFGIGVNITFFFLGLKIAPSVNAPMIAAAGPIFILLFSSLWLKEKIRRKLIFGTLISLIGVITIIFQPFLEQNSKQGNILGNFFFLIATLGGVFHALLSKIILKRYPAVVITFWSFLIGSLLFLPFFLWENQQNLFLNSINQQGIIGLVFGVVFSSALAYFLYQWGIQKIKMAEVGIFTYLDPVVAIFIAKPLLNETITLTYLLGTILVFGGIYLAEGRLNYQFFWQLIKKRG